MHPRFLLTAVVATGLGAAACSHSAPTREQARSSAEPARKIELPAVPAAADQLVSDLEAKRVSKSVPSRAPAKTAVAVTTAAPPEATVRHDHAAMALADLAPSTNLTTSSALQVRTTYAVAPMPLMPLDSKPSRSSPNDLVLEPVNFRPPAILIRGGMGGVDDKCDLHARGGRGPGIAINSFSPRPGGFGRSGGGGFRGGIR